MARHANPELGLGALSHDAAELADRIVRFRADGFNVVEVTLKNRNGPLGEKVVATAVDWQRAGLIAAALNVSETSD